MKKRGEITVFLSLVTVCILSLCMGLLESARTAGARLYAQMAAEAAVTSLMSQYNRNLWDMYHLLFLEAESETAMEQSFSEYLNFYFSQENLYPMSLEEVHVTEKSNMTDDGGKWLEESVLSYVNYRLPDIAGDYMGIVEDAGHAEIAGDFRELFQICRDAGKKTRKLEKYRLEIEGSLSDMREYLNELEDAVGNESEGRFETYAYKLTREIEKFSGNVDVYEAEIQNISEHLEELRLETEDVEESNTVKSLELQENAPETSVSGHMFREIATYEQVESSAKRALENYRGMEPTLAQNMRLLDEALVILEEETYEYVFVGTNWIGAGTDAKESGENGGTGSGDSSSGEYEDVYEWVPVGPDWDAIGSVLAQMEIPGDASGQVVDREKVSMLDRLEALFQGDLLDLVLPKGKEVSRKYASLRGIPSGEVKQQSETSKSEGQLAVRKILVNEYCFLHFDSFLESGLQKTEPIHQTLDYEQEYLLCGEASDRENLAQTAEKLLTVRGSMNLLCLLNSPEKQAEAEALALAVSGGNAPVKFILSFFILTMWAFGEAVLDVRILLSGKTVPFWKQESQWNVSLEQLLSLNFLDMKPDAEDGDGRGYKDHLRILFFLMKEETRNFRMMDVIQWNVRSRQEDFAVKDCVMRVELEADIRERHLFLMKNGYRRTVRTVGIY